MLPIRSIIEPRFIPSSFESWRECPLVKDLVTRLSTSEEFRYHSHFTGSDATLSETAYSRLIYKLQGLSVFQESHDRMIYQAFQEGFIGGTKVTVDATHVEARYAANPAKKHSRKKKGQYCFGPSFSKKISTHIWPFYAFANLIMKLNSLGVKIGECGKIT